MKAYPGTSGQRCKALLGGGILLLGLALSTRAWASGPQVKAYGKTYGDWSALWWQWVHSIPAGTNPVTDTTGAHCDAGQGDFENDKVWFLAGTQGGQATRTCTIPHGKALFYPLVNAFFINGLNENFPVEEKQTALAEVLDLACGLRSTLDGVATVIARPTVRTQSPPFRVEIGPESIYGYPEGLVDDHVVADGYWVILPPLSVGTHTLELEGAVCDSSTHLPIFEVQVTSHLTIVGD